MRYNKSVLYFLVVLRNTALKLWKGAKTLVLSEVDFQTPLCGEAPLHHYHVPQSILYCYVRPLLVGCSDRNLFHTCSVQLTVPKSKEPTLTHRRTLLAFGFDWLCYQWHGNVTGVQVLHNVGCLLLSDQPWASLYWLEFQSLPVWPYREDVVSKTREHRLIKVLL